jgi:hypothetical protein
MKSSLRFGTAFVAWAALAAGCGITVPGGFDLDVDPSTNAGRGGVAGRGGIAGGIAVPNAGSTAPTPAGAPSPPPIAGRRPIPGGTGHDPGAGGYGGFDAPYPSLDRDHDGFADYKDCNDADPSVFPGAMDACCDGRDSDCDGRDAPTGVDCQCTTPNNVDWDGDGCPVFVDCNDYDANYCHECPWQADNDGDGCPASMDCDDSDARFCGQCPSFIDKDGDGYAQEQDCDDWNPHVNPGLGEICGDGIDNNCDGSIDGYPYCSGNEIDWDRDGYPAAKDCNDGDSAVYPGSSFEICCDGVDTNCDGFDGYAGIPCSCGMAIDRDGDGFGIGMSDPALADCNDQDATIHPKAFEVCNDGRDNDCDGITDLADPDCSGSGFPID